MITVVFHKALLPYTNGKREVQLVPDTYLYVVKNCLNLFPDLEKAIIKQRFSKSDNLAVIVDNKILTKDDLFFTAKSDKRIYLAPIFYGGDPGSFGIAIATFFFSTVIASSRGYGIGDALLQGLIAGAFSLAGAFVGAAAASSATGAASLFIRGAVSGVFAALSSLVAGAVTGPPKQDTGAADGSGKVANDLFGSIANTANQGEAVALNYGMLRIGGQIISSEIETITDQRFPDPTVEADIDNQNSWQGNDAYGANFSSNLPNDYYGVAADLASSGLDGGFSYGENSSGGGGGAAP